MLNQVTIGIVDFFEAFFGGLVAVVAVWMIAPREFFELFFHD
jgi:hypothetical protein